MTKKVSTTYAIDFNIFHAIMYMINEEFKLMTPNKWTVKTLSYAYIFVK